MSCELFGVSLGIVVRLAAGIQVVITFVLAGLMVGDALVAVLAPWCVYFSVVVVMFFVFGICFCLRCWFVWFPRRCGFFV